MRNPLQVYADKNLLHAALEHRKEMGKCSSPSDLRKALSIYSGTQTVSNFAPLAAASLFDRYLSAEGGSVYDPCAGWGGRLVGALACPKIGKYIACEPSTLTFDGLSSMRDELLPIMKRLGRRVPEIQLRKRGAEDFRPEKGSCQMSIMSSPYYDHEKYSDEETQSFVRFKTPAKWLDGFLGATLTNCHSALAASGILVVNIAGVPSYPDLTEHCFWMAGRCGFRPMETLRLALSAMPGTRITGSAYKFEPVYVFRKF
jgi:hypothetical protein